LKLFKEGFLIEFLEVGQEELKGEIAPQELKHETPILGDLNNIAGGFFGGENSASSRIHYARAVMSLDVKKYEKFAEPSLCFTGSNLKDVFPHENDHVVISVIIIGRKVHRVLIDQGSSTDVMF